MGFGQLLTLKLKIMLGTSFPGAGQKANARNLNLLNGSGSYYQGKSMGFVNPPKLKSEMTLDLLKQLDQVRHNQKAYQNRLKKIIIGSVIAVIAITAVLMTYL